MNFTSTAFLSFFLVFFSLYWFVLRGRTREQNVLLLAGSYFFYGWADWRFLVFLVVVSFLNFLIGIQIGKRGRKRSVFKAAGLLLGLGSLLYFKYFNFFITSVNDVLLALNVNFNLQTLSVIVPVGISFFTFRTIGYLLDIDNRKIEPTKNWIVFFNYVSFFPSLLAGPIDKAKKLVPQLEQQRTFQYENATNGLRQVLWGFFKKVVIADNCAPITHEIFSNYDSLPGSTLLLGAFLYTIQIYADFSGYSDMAIGFARLLGFEITRNFNFPFFAQNIAEFWRKWHISLTSWLTEYLFVPLNITFRDYGRWGLALAIMINFVIVGSWHGANWTYVVFGFIHGCAFLPLVARGVVNKKRKLAKGKLIPTAGEFWNMVSTFFFVMLTFVIFRAASMQQAVDYFTQMWSASLVQFPVIPAGNLVPLTANVNVVLTLGFISFMFLLDWLGKDCEYAIEKTGQKWPRLVRWSFYSFLIFLIGMYAHTDETAFIYFQF